MNYTQTICKCNGNAGFFACCSLRLVAIRDFVVKIKKIPDIMDSSRQFEWYKVKGKESEDITFDYFENYNNVETAEIKTNISFYHDHQFKPYEELDYNGIIPLIKKYFSPSNKIKEIIDNIEKKYNLDYNNTCVLFYRGNDKNTETKICQYEEYLKYSDEILEKHPNTKFLIQSDETEFIEFMTKMYPDNSFYFKDEIRHIKKCNSTVDIEMQETNNLFSKYFLAITIIMSKCKYLIFGTGNCSMWIVFFRGHNNNTIQNFKNKWYNYYLID